MLRPKKPYSHNFSFFSYITFNLSANLGAYPSKYIQNHGYNPGASHLIHVLPGLLHWSSKQSPCFHPCPLHCILNN